MKKKYFYKLLISFIFLLTVKTYASIYDEPLFTACKSNNTQRVLREIRKIENASNYIDLLHLSYVYSIECQSFDVVNAMIAYQSKKGVNLFNNYFAFSVACAEGFANAARWLVVTNIERMNYVLTEDEVLNQPFDVIENILSYNSFYMESLSDYGYDHDGYFRFNDQGNLFGRHYTYLLHSKKRENLIAGEPFYRLDKWSETYFNRITKKEQGFDYGWLHFILLKEGLDKFELACLFNNLELAQFLYGSTDDVDSTKVIRAFFLACLRGNTEIIKWLIEQKGLDPLVRLFDENALLFACKGDQMETAQWLINYGFSIKDVDTPKCNAFMYACRNGNIEMAEWLYSLGANIAQIGSGYEFGFDDEISAMDLAIKHGHTEIVEWLNQLSEEGSREEIILAAEYGHLEILDFLYKKYTNIDSVYNYKFYLEWFEKDSVQYMLKQDRIKLLSDTDDRGRTAFVAACENGHLHILNWLISKGYSGEDDYKSTKHALLIKAVENRNYELVEWLIEKFGYYDQQIGSRENWRLHWEVMDPYFMACINRDKKMAQYLKSKGADPNIILPTGKNHLTILASSIDSPQLGYQVLIMGDSYAYVNRDNNLLFDTLKVFFSTGADPYRVDNNGVSFVTHPNIVKNPEILAFVKRNWKK
jgi:ankyrin repeat protein